jgi:hypothetical protein
LSSRPSVEGDTHPTVTSRVVNAPARLPIVSIETVDERVPVFNLEAMSLHTFFAFGVLVHNNKSPKTDGAPD